MPSLVLSVLICYNSVIHLWYMWLLLPLFQFFQFYWCSSALLHVLKNQSSTFHPSPLDDIPGWPLCVLATCLFLCVCSCLWLVPVLDSSPGPSPMGGMRLLLHFCPSQATKATKETTFATHKPPNILHTYFLPVLGVVADPGCWRYYHCFSHLCLVPWCLQATYLLPLMWCVLSIGCLLAYLRSLLLAIWRPSRTPYTTYPDCEDSIVRDCSSFKVWHCWESHISPWQLWINFF